MKIYNEDIQVWVTACDNNGRVILNETYTTNCPAASRTFAEADIPAQFHNNIVITDLNNNPVEE